ncbi:hypothetical protein BU24DRAFT_427338 [Aaosphaeria arxii CBS 175.79]|uniref:Uncharacterized protein n=1 Tax=Aaosphaeria arxii CBS 175.79 TaxID=1450172 RepID=A0A6A5XE15_9PLEO|nr:uncharacterized protein BU24DRAFT_427338 [Aaosphaeria arxii CBS 175.79]KAF2011130.1 hypothetical protein BU24DRAFT_427338 [Aaosphaeria arxii CBS 175.79]
MRFSFERDSSRNGAYWVFYPTPIAWDNAQDNTLETRTPIQDETCALDSSRRRTAGAQPPSRTARTRNRRSSLLVVATRQPVSKHDRQETLNLPARLSISHARVATPKTVKATVTIQRRQRAPQHSYDEPTMMAEPISIPSHPTLTRSPGRTTRTREQHADPVVASSKPIPIKSQRARARDTQVEEGQSSLRRCRTWLRQFSRRSYEEEDNDDLLVLQCGDDVGEAAFIKRGKDDPDILPAHTTPEELYDSSMWTFG